MVSSHPIQRDKLLPASRELRELFLQGVAVSVPLVCHSHADIHLSLEVLQHPFVSWVPLDGPATASLLALSFKLSALGPCFF